jgi:hypothetical protein
LVSITGLLKSAIEPQFLGFLELVQKATLEQKIVIKDSEKYVTRAVFIKFSP